VSSGYALIRLNRGRRAFVPFGVSILGCDHPIENSSREEEVRVFEEDVAELLSDLDDEQRFVNKFMIILFQHFMDRILQISDFCGLHQLSIGFDSNILNY
jgi:hypothetical protein